MAAPRDFQYEPLGVCRDFFCSREPEILLAGPAGTGKSFCALNKIDFLATKYAGSRHLIVRKTRASLTNSALVTFEEKVLREGSAVLRDNLQRKTRTSYRYPNGSEVVIGGMDDPMKILSTEYDTAYAQEAVELKLSDYEPIVSRLRYGRMPYSQFLSDTNPGPSSHWLKRRSEQDRLDLSGKPTGKKMVTIYEGKHSDNPFLWDKKERKWTDFGLEYVTRLSNYTGTMRQRLYEGKWVSAEGLVFPEFDPEIHVISRRDMPVIPHHWPHYMVIDFGYKSPFACLWAAVNPTTKVIYVYRELYQTEVIVSEHAKRIKRLNAGEPQPVAIICDHDAEGRATFEAETGWRTIPAKKSVEINIQEFRDRLTPDKNGQPGIMFFDDMLIDRDEKFASLGEPLGAIEEFGAYCYKEHPDRVNPKEKPIDKCDHSLQAIGYLTTELASHYGEWKGHRNLPAAPEPMVLKRDPVGPEGRSWFPFPRLSIPEQRKPV